MKKEKKEYPVVSLACTPCGITANYLTCLKRFGRPPERPGYESSTFHVGTCDVCGIRRDVTETRDFFHPDFSLIFRKMRKHRPVDISKEEGAGGGIM